MTVIELEKYTCLLDENAQKFMNGELEWINCDTLFNYYLFLKKKWREILDQRYIPKAYQAAISFTLMVYMDKNKLEELFSKYRTLEVFSNYFRTLTRMRKEPVLVEELISFDFNIDKIDKSNCISHFEYLVWLTYYYISKRDFDITEILLTKLEFAYERIENNITNTTTIYQMETMFMYTKALFYHIQTNFIESEKLYTNTLNKLGKADIHDNFLLGLLHNGLGNLYKSVGEKKAVNQYNLACQAYEKLQSERGIAVTKANIALLYIKEGRLQEALSILLRVRKTMETYEDRMNQLILNLEIHSCLSSLEWDEEAEDYLNKAFEITKKHHLEYERVYLVATEFYANRKEFRKAETNLKRYQRVAKIKEKGKRKSATYRIYKGLLQLKKKNLGESESFINSAMEIAKEQNHSSLVLKASLINIELLIIKYRLENNFDKKSEIIQQIEQISRETIDLLHESKSFFQIVNYQILLSIAYILSQKYDLAIGVLHQAGEIANKYNFEPQLKQIEKYKQILTGLVLDTHTPNLETNLQLMRADLEMSMKDFSIHSKINPNFVRTIQKPNLRYLLVILSSGLPIFSYNFMKSRIEGSSELLLAGLINAIQNFSSTISAKKGVFRTLEHTDYLVLLEPREEYTIALFTDRFSYELKEAINEFAKLIEKYRKDMETNIYSDDEEKSRIEQILTNEVEKIFDFKRRKK